MTALRVPFEPRTVLQAIEPTPATLQTRLAAAYAAKLGARVRRQGFRTPDRVFGLAWSGAMLAPRIEGLLARLPDGLTEIYTHPATSNAFAGAVPGYRYAEELSALLSPGVRAAATRSGARLTGYADAAATAVSAANSRSAGTS